MIERKIYTIIKNQLDWFKADTGQRFEQFLLNELEVDAVEAANLRLFFAGGTSKNGQVVEARPPTLIHGYARPGGPFPCWALTLGSEREKQAYLNEDAVALDEDGDRFMDPLTGDIVDAKVRRVDYSFNVLVLHDNPDVVLFYYHLLKRIILSQRDAFLAADLYTPMIGGADLAPNAQYLPSDIFARQLTITIDAEECWAMPDLGTGTSVGGIAIDDTGEGVTSGDASGSATAGVTAYGS